MKEDKKLYDNKYFWCLTPFLVKSKALTLLFCCFKKALFIK
jgi:hypothetical protein